jgi:hypothetical protein
MAKVEELAKSKDEFERHYNRIRYYIEMSAKYARAYRSPWLSVEPDPPEPE